jgi:hypothetical protein
MKHETYSGRMIENLIATVERAERAATYGLVPEVSLPEMPIAYLAQYSYGEELVVA